MLILSRKLGERIVINLPLREGRGVENITITVIDIDRGKIRIGIDAPRDLPVYRTELLERMEREGLENAKGYEGDAGRQQQGQDAGGRGTGPNSAGIL
jgi:carbon storage regulator